MGLREDLALCALATPAALYLASHSTKTRPACALDVSLALH